MATDFPYNNQGQPMSEQGVIVGTAGISANGSGFFRVSTMNSPSVTATTSPLSADSSTVSAKQGDAGLLRVSAIQGDAGLLMVSTKSGDAGLMRVSSIGGTFSLSGDAAGNRVSAIQGDAALLRISTIQGDAGLMRVSSIGSTSVSFDGDAANNRVSAVQRDAANLNASAKSNDAGTLLVSAKQGDAGLLLVSAKQGDAGLLRVSALGYVSAYIDNGSVSAKSGDANQFHVSSVQGDAALLRVSVIGGDAANQRVSSILEADTATKLSTFSTSAGIAVTSAIKASKANLYGYQLGNRAGVDQWLLIFNASATSAVTLGTTVADKMVYTPATGGANLAWPIPPTFSNGIVVAVVSAPGGTTAGASAMTVNIDYK